MTYVLLFLGVVVLVMASCGIANVRIGLRGVRTGHEPHCLTCDFDLSGDPTTPKCPECGTAITDDKLICGHLSPSPARVKRGVAQLVPIALCIASFGLPNAKTMYGWLPSPVLVPIAKVSSSPHALNELSSRILAGSLSQADIDVLVASALAKQLDLEHLWVPQWGDIVEAAFAQDKLALPTFSTYLAQAVTVEVSMPRRVTRDTTPEYAISLQSPRYTWAGARLGTSTSEYRIRLTTVSVDGVDWPVDLSGPATGEDRWITFANSRTSIRSTAVSPSFPSVRLTPLNFPSGDHTATFLAQITATPCTNLAASRMLSAGQLTFIVPVTVPIEVREPGIPLADPITDPAAVAELVRRLTVTVRNADTRGGFYPEIHLTAQSPNINAAFEVEVRSGDLVWTSANWRFQFARNRTLYEFASKIDWMGFEIQGSTRPPITTPPPAEVQVRLIPIDASAARCRFESALAVPITFDHIPVLLGSALDTDGMSGASPDTTPGFELPPEPKPDPLPRPSAEPSTILSPPAPR